MKYLNDNDLSFCVSFNQQWLKENNNLKHLTIWQQIKRETKVLELELDKRRRE